MPKTKDLITLAALVESVEETRPQMSASEAIRYQQTLVHQNREDRVSYYFDEFVKNEGEQLNHPVKLEDQLQNRARYILSHRAIQDACLLWGANAVIGALLTAWWNKGDYTVIPVAWKPLVAVLIETAEQYYCEEITISDRVQFE